MGCRLFCWRDPTQGAVGLAALPNVHLGFGIWEGRERSKTKRGRVSCAQSQGFHVCNHAVASKPRPERAAATPACVTMSSFWSKKPPGAVSSDRRRCLLGLLGLMQFKARSGKTPKSWARRAAWSFTGARRRLKTQIARSRPPPQRRRVIERFFLRAEKRQQKANVVVCWQ